MGLLLLGQIASWEVMQE